MMLFLLALPVVFVVARVCLFLQVYAPSNVLIARVRAAPPRWRTVMFLLPLAYTLIWAAHCLTIAIESGAPSWLNLVVLILAWDSIKTGLVSASVAFCCTRETCGSMRRTVRFLASPGGKGA